VGPDLGFDAKLWATPPTRWPTHTETAECWGISVGWRSSLLTELAELKLPKANGEGRTRTTSIWQRGENGGIIDSWDMGEFLDASEVAPMDGDCGISVPLGACGT
jgi:hypothetical protein